VQRPDGRRTDRRASGPIGTGGAGPDGAPLRETPSAEGATVSDPGSEPWYDGISPEHQAMVDHLTRMLAWGVQVAGSVNTAFCDAVHERCREALWSDPRLRDLVEYAHGIANVETTREFTAHGPTTKARLWADLEDRLEALTGADAPDGP
jgi:hypothetical protein